MRAESRTTYAEVDPRLMPLLDRRDEGLRLQSFCQSSRTRGGRVAPLRPFEVTHPFAGFATEAEYLGNAPDPLSELD